MQPVVPDGGRTSVAMTQLAHPVATPSPAVRWLLAVLLGAAAGWLAFAWLSRNPGYHGGDFTYAWRAANHVLAGRNPYAHMPAAAYGLGGPFLYPLPAAFVALPFGPLPVQLAAGLFLGTTTALMVFGLTKDGFWRLWLLPSASFFTCITTAQWSPLMIAAALLPPLGWVVIAKPNLGFAALAHRPGKLMIVGTILLVLAAFIFEPTWPYGWLEHLGLDGARHDPIAFTPIGAIALLALLRWRTAEGRLVAALSIVPTAAWPYDHLMLWLAAKSWKEAALLSVSSWFVYVAIHATAPHDLTRDVSTVQTLLAIGLYLPALVFVLRRPNEGRIPQWLERLALRLPPWLRGSPVAS